MKKLYVIKVGGNIIDDQVRLKNFLLDFSHIRGNKILVHGGGKTVNDLSRRLGIEPVIEHGRRVTDEETLKIITMVYAGLINKNIVAWLQSYSCNAIGLSGPDANIIPAIKRRAGDFDFGFAGDIDQSTIQAPVLKTLIEIGLTPVLSPVTHDQRGGLLNTNADTIASEVATALSRFYNVSLIYCFEKKGVLKNINDEHSIIPQINSENYTALKNDGVIEKGMIPKLDNAFNALGRGVKSVKICNADKLLNLINSPEIIGTEICV
ncbi:MAG: acetylglutamate kinase [Bacteroidetes bacterium]|nr:acetylglutamate kinase [Bacteroidota bacterium]